MSDSEKTMYVNGNIETSNAFDNDKTVYVGKEENTPVENQTVYIGKESNISKDAVVETDSQTVYIAKETSSVESHTTNHVELEEEYIPDKKEEVISESVNLDRTPETAQKEENETLYYLPTNTMLQKRYRINSVLGEGGFGITYSGWDITLNIPVAIKEYYPTGLVTRNATLGKTTQVVPVASSKYASQFRDGIDRVLDEARRMAKFRNTPGIVGIYDFFEANNTAYIVMEYVQGSTLDVYYKNNRVDNTTLFNMLVPVMDALQALHNEGIIHRDISPDNIMVDEDGNFKLLDFGAARGYTEESSTTMSIILKKSYAPEEQFRSKGVQGPWTDVYALAASIYELITGQTPPTSIDRLVEDEIIDIRELAPSLTKSQADAIMTALAVKKTNRIQSMDDLKNKLLNVNLNSISMLSNETKGEHSSNKEIEKKVNVIEENKNYKKLGVVVVTIIIILIILGIPLSSRFSTTKSDPQKNLVINESSDENQNNEVFEDKDTALSSDVIETANGVDETNYIIQVDDKADKLSKEEELLLSKKIQRIETAHKIDLAIVTINENLTEYAENRRNRYDGVIGHQVDLYAEDYSKANKMGIDYEKDVMLFLDNWNRDADGMLYSVLFTNGKCSELISPEDCTEILSTNLIDFEKDNSSPYVQYNNLLDDISNRLESSEGLLEVDAENIEYRILENGTVVSGKPGVATGGKFQLVDATIVKTSASKMTVSFKIKTLSLVDWMGYSSFPISCLDENGFTLKDLFLDASKEVGVITTDTQELIPIETKQIIIKGTEPLEIDDFDDVKAVLLENEKQKNENLESESTKKIGDTQVMRYQDMEITYNGYDTTDDEIKLNLTIHNDSDIDMYYLFHQRESYFEGYDVPISGKKEEGYNTTKTLLSHKSISLQISVKIEDLEKLGMTQINQADIKFVKKKEKNSGAETFYFKLEDLKIVL